MSEVQTVVFQKRGKKKSNLGSVFKKLEKQKKEEDEKDVFDFKKARNDVFKLGVSGLDSGAKIDAKIAHAIRLGAAPPKNKYVNYKVLMEERKKEKEKQLLDRNEGRDRFSSTSIGGVSKKRQKKKKRDMNDVPGLDYQVGKYKSGVQVIQKNDLKKR